MAYIYNDYEVSNCQLDVIWNIAYVQNYCEQPLSDTALWFKSVYCHQR